jgi:hypothetical protein
LNTNQKSGRTFAQLLDRYRVSILKHVAPALVDVGGPSDLRSPDTERSAPVALAATAVRDADLADQRVRISHLEAAIERLSGLLGDEIQRLSDQLGGEIVYQRKRLDYAIGELDGLAPLREHFHQARRSADYQAAFSVSNPLVTICVTTMNNAELLIERCLASVLTQTYKNLQIVVVGDHCTDDTEKRISDLRDNRITFHNLSQRGPYPLPGVDRWRVAGTYPANFAVSLAEGRFITHLDEDDRYEPNRIEVLLAAAQQQRADFVWHRFWFLQPDGAWKLWGDGSLEHAQVGSQMTFYHGYFKRLLWDVYAYRMHEPGDWNRIRKFKHLRAKTFFVDQPLTWYHKNYSTNAFVAQDRETFLD